ncbi:alpha/beta hydrolase [Mycobacterium montefiorense]|uniref:Alpha/beta hydrolase n=1 Tax=Mycobacterium montefiorense TaxID=154654 RepID=A0AA37PKN0_9MYCO|nr:alpha/beta fold hydrolase [Mycobacterium montefiorense]GBG39109.1 alpha/beta hydrolase [Mycobacterium montefiorense]GKU37417.1 alpha/beta hydrolase [Mycobacterium montefiorense]GKU42065.1 alpha/beta hydrolase [Mycobacterium montefiorense]GKU45473.1 alpha/beta hydrolase [Mycobacterium montefiorense]GKU53566.1 alpha/beta hydrolase [Mycobacterium montefiorense]
MIEVIDKGETSEEHPHPLLFVHGGFQGAWCWDVNFLDYFAGRGFRVVAPSYRGHGASPVDKSMRLCSISDFVEDVASIANTLVPQPIPIGHSMGGFIVQKYLESNDAPAGVLLASAPPRGHLRSMLRAMRKYPLSSNKFALTGRPADMCGGTLAGARDTFFGPSTPESVVIEGMGRLRPDSTRAILGDMVALKLVKTTRVTTPLLVLGSEHDGIYPPADVRRTAKAYGTEASIFPSMGHEMMLESDWVTVADHIVSWLNERGL